MNSGIKFERFCVLCGSTKEVNRSGYRPKKIILVERRETSDLGFICDKCNLHLENGKVFTKPRK